MRTPAIGISLSLLSVVLVASTFAAVPRLINYQGIITDSGGLPVTGTHDLKFSVYADSSEAAVALWDETHLVVNLDEGLFNVILGGVAPIPEDLFEDAERWMGITVDTDSEMRPRQQITSVPWALRAAVAETTLTAPDVAPHAHDDRYYTEGELNSAGTINDPANPVDWTRLKSVPAGFADGTDDAGGTGDGHSLDAADGDPVDALYVDDYGNVGMGTTTPDRRLHLSGDNPRILIEAETSSPEVNFIHSGDPDSALWSIYKSPDGDLRFYQYLDRVSIEGGSGNVGIGGSYPDLKLNVDGELGMWGVRVLSAGIPYTHVGVNAGSEAYLGVNTFVGYGAGFQNTFADSNTFIGYLSGQSNYSGHSNTFVGHQAGQSNQWASHNTFLGSGAGWTNGMGNDNTFLGAGAGFGNTGGYENVFVGAGAGRRDSSGSENSYIGFGAGSDNYAGSGNVYIGYKAGFYRAGSDELVIANGQEDSDILVYGDFATGHVGLGTTAPVRDLHIYGVNPRILLEASSASPEINFKTPGDGAEDMWAIYKHGTTEDLRFYQAGDKLTIEKDTGNVGIGTAAPTRTLFVYGDAGGTGAWHNDSDARLKECVRTVDSALDKVTRLRGVYFEWKDGGNYPDGVQLGLIAQEVNEVVPEAVDRKGEYYSIAPTSLIPVLIEAIKEQQQQINELKAELAAQE